MLRLKAELLLAKALEETPTRSLVNDIENILENAIQTAKNSEADFMQVWETTC